MKKKLKQIQEDRKNAKHGDFFFAKYNVSNSQKVERESPVFVISNDQVFLLRINASLLLTLFYRNNLLMHGKNSYGSY